MTNKEMAQRLVSLLPDIRVRERFVNRLEIKTDAKMIPGVLVLMKSEGFEHLSNITCVDWIGENRFDVTYNLWSYKHRLHAVIKAGVPRNEPAVPTAKDVWPHAQVYEREIHEMFGVCFHGNPDLSPLYLHNWHDIPPLRKDFDTEEYSRRAYGVVDDVEETML